MSLSSIFEPRSVAVIGASVNGKKWGGRIFKNIIDGGYRGEVYPINHREKKIGEKLCYPSILDSPGAELAIIAIPAESVLKAAEECGQKGTKGLVVVTAGFGEVGAAGKELEKELVGIIEKYDMRMIGPNTLGIANAHIKLNATIISQMPRPGPISFITQSGTLGLALADWTVDMGLGLRIVVSTGNKADVDDVDLLEYLGGDPETGVIAMYVEGINRGKKFLETAQKVKKPIVAIKTGRSTRGAKAVFSHTGSLAGSDQIYTAAFKQGGILRMDTIEEVFDAALALSCQPLPKSNRVAIISNGGAASIIASDACEKYGIEIADLSEETIRRLKAALPPYASPVNPVDTAGSSSYETYKETIEALFLDPNVDALIVIYVHTIMSDAVPPAQAAMEVKRKFPKPMITCWMGGAGTERGVAVLKEGCMPNYPLPERAVKALASLIQHRDFLTRVKK